MSVLTTSAVLRNAVFPSIIVGEEGIPNCSCYEKAAAFLCFRMNTPFPITSPAAEIAAPTKNKNGSGAFLLPNTIWFAVSKVQNSVSISPAPRMGTANHASFPQKPFAPMRTDSVKDKTGILKKPVFSFWLQAKHKFSKQNYFSHINLST